MLSYNSVIIVSNEEKYIKRSIDSIPNQSITPYRVMVVDDGSTGVTPDILSSMRSTVNSFPYKDSDASAFYHILSNIKNAGLVLVRAVPVYWAYSGDADILWPPKFCENIMSHVAENDTYTGSGIPKNENVSASSNNICGTGELMKDPTRRDGTVTQDGFLMIRNYWLRSIGMETKWASVYLCVLVLMPDTSTLVPLSNDCVIVYQRLSGGHTLVRQYQKGLLVSIDICFILCCPARGVRAKIREPKAWYRYCVLVRRKDGSSRDEKHVRDDDGPKCSQTRRTVQRNAGHAWHEPAILSTRRLRRSTKAQRTRDSPEASIL